MDADTLRRMREDYRRTFLATAHGVRVLEDLLRECGIFDASASCNSSTFRSEGRRDIGIKILSALDKRSYQGLIELEKKGLELTQFYMEDEQ
jgi:hydroxymethylpyrimidine pyrophosphatase-like HAD family hydrolase